MVKKYLVARGNADHQVIQDLEAAAKSTFGYNAIFVLPLIAQALSQSEVKKGLADIQVACVRLGRKVFCSLEAEPEAGFEGEADISELEFKFLCPTIEAVMHSIAMKHIPRESFVLAIYDQKTRKSIFRAVQPAAYKGFDADKYRAELDQGKREMQERAAAELLAKLIMVSSEAFSQDGVIFFQPEGSSVGTFKFKGNPDFSTKTEGAKRDIARQFKDKLTAFLLMAQRMYGPGKVTVKFQDGSMEEYPFLLEKPKSTAAAGGAGATATATAVSAEGAAMSASDAEKNHFRDLLTRAGFVFNSEGTEVVGLQLGAAPLPTATVMAPQPVAKSASAEVRLVTEDGSALRWPLKATSTWFDISEGDRYLSAEQRRKFLDAFAPLNVGPKT